MDADNCAVACSLVSKTYVQQGSQALAARRRLIKTLLSQRRLPEQGWDDATIEMLLQARRLPCIADKRQLSSRTAPWQAGDGTPFHVYKPADQAAHPHPCWLAGCGHDGQQQLPGQCGGGGARGAGGQRAGGAPPLPPGARHRTLRQAGCVPRTSPPLTRCLPPPPGSIHRLPAYRLQEILPRSSPRQPAPPCWPSSRTCWRRMRWRRRA